MKPKESYSDSFSVLYECSQSCLWSYFAHFDMFGKCAPTQELLHTENCNKQTHSSKQC